MGRGRFPRRSRPLQGEGGGGLVSPPSCSADRDPACDTAGSAWTARCYGWEGGCGQRDRLTKATQQANHHALSPAGSRTPVEQQTHIHPRRPRLVIAMRCLLYEIRGVKT